MRTSKGYLSFYLLGVFVIFPPKSPLNSASATLLWSKLSWKSTWNLYVAHSCFISPTLTCWHPPPRLWEGSEGHTSLSLIYSSPPTYLKYFLKEAFIQLMPWRVKKTETPWYYRVVMNVSKETIPGMFKCLVSPQTHRSVACLTFWWSLNSFCSCSVVGFPAKCESHDGPKCWLTGPPHCFGWAQFCIFLLEQYKDNSKSNGG